MKLKEFSFVTVGIVITFLAISATLFFFGPPQIPLWYSLSLPEQQLEQKVAIFLFPTAMATFSIFNFAFAKKTKNIDPVLQQLFLYSSCIPLIILTIACIHILILIV